MRKTSGYFVLLLSMALLFSSCGGGGGGSAGSGGSGQVGALTVAEKVSVVDAQSGGAQGQVLGMRIMTAPPVPANSDYNNDRANVYVEERSVESFNTVNEILCMMAQTRYDAMLNRGAYKAQVDTNLCKGRDDASTGGQQSANQSSSSDMPQYEMWTVEASRADNTASQIVKVWVHESAG
ncbi:MAG: hypothetical protein HZA60_07490, partial [Deltaproteobacteria bacterium]|nr:hypothetical protein [Deltaproteobacteria bacterium]